jgi:acyl-coenzyme A thioesterase PaaI-like protein
VITIDSVLRAGLGAQDDEFRLTLDPRLSGLPDTAHGGSVLAAFHALAGIVGPQRVSGIYRKRVPLGTPLRLTVARGRDGVTCELFDDAGTVLVDGGARGADDAPLTPVPAGDGGDPLPLASTCLACGVDNALGLRAQLRFDDERVWTRWTPRDTAARPDGSLAPIALTTLLDEAAFWLGALASGESGMTTELAVTLHREIAFGEPVVVAGTRGRTRPRDDDRFWETEITAADASGDVVASGRIVFVAVRGSARRLLGGFLARSSPEILRRIFPTYAR